MQLFLYGVWVSAASNFDEQEVEEITKQVVQERVWENRRLGRIELMKAGEMIRVCVYEEPVVQYIPMKREGEKDEFN
ncbi:hypothetical protein [uncultured Anaeromusa sp.]|uniref:hypothetical protein n=2 Tax=Sporomusaceae TaxID=1843490 RepID=UPI0029C6870A|nr:hypothetical protein [uncultured Anaeromusa sp.]